MAANAQLLHEAIYYGTMTSQLMIAVREQEDCRFHSIDEAFSKDAPPMLDVTSSVVPIGNGVELCIPTPPGALGDDMRILTTCEISSSPSEATSCNAPPFQGAVLLKCPPTSQYHGKIGSPMALRAAESGVRSAIVFDDTSRTYIKLKGCGDAASLFSFRPPPVGAQSGASVKVELRGANYEHLCLRELMMCTAVNSALSRSLPHRHVPAMEPLGYWTYKGAAGVATEEYLRSRAVEALSSDITRGPFLPWPSAAFPTCSLFRVNGDRRLESHLLHGMERLAELVIRPCILNEPTAQRLLCALTSCFPPSRKQDDGSVLPTWVAVVEHGKALFSHDDSSELHRNLAETGRWELPSFKSTDDGAAAAQSIFAASHVAPCFEGELLRQLEQSSLFTHDPDSLIHALVGLCARIGAEVGSILRGMHKSRISWGTYSDILGTHCNAHTNNLVVVDPNAIANSEFSTERFLLSPVDFDMAYHLDALPRAPVTNGCLHADETLVVEGFGMMLCLARDDCNSGAAEHETTHSTGAAEGPWGTLLEVCVTLMRDTLVKNFAIAYTDNSQSVSTGRVGPRDTSVVEVALMLSHDVVA